LVAIPVLVLMILFILFLGPRNLTTLLIALFLGYKAEKIAESRAPRYYYIVEGRLPRRYYFDEDEGI